ncbi:MAG TPA: hypothetical protein VN641_13530 [Urbifossiella sp.]|nr:hypothetical protein [Urbifossiella sp.]
MFRLAAGFVLVVATAFAAAQDKKGIEPALHTASGSVDKASKDSLSIRPRGADGKFQKAIALKVTGTSKISVLTPQKRGDKVILTQRDADAKDLVKGQTVAVIYAEAGKDSVLLSAVAHAAPGK